MAQYTLHEVTWSNTKDPNGNDPNREFPRYVDVSEWICHWAAFMIQADSPHFEGAWVRANSPNAVQRLLLARGSGSTLRGDAMTQTKSQKSHKLTKSSWKRWLIALLVVVSGSFRIFGEMVPSATLRRVIQSSFTAFIQYFSKENEWVLCSRAFVGSKLLIVNRVMTKRGKTSEICYFLEGHPSFPERWQ